MRYVLNQFMKELTVLLTQSILVIARMILKIVETIFGFISSDRVSIFRVSWSLFLRVNVLLIIIHLSLFSLLIHFKLTNDFFVVFDTLIQQSSSSAKAPSVSNSVESVPSTFRGDELRPIGWYQNFLLTFVQDDLSPLYSFFWSELKKEEKGCVPGFVQQSNTVGRRNPKTLFSYSAVYEQPSFSAYSSKSPFGGSGECRYCVDESNWDDERVLGLEECPVPLPSLSDSVILYVRRPSMEELISD